MKILTILAVSGLAVSSSAMAQTTDVETGGLYVGGHVSYSNRESDWLDLGAGPLGGHDANGVQLGVQAGYDFDLGPVFVGVDGRFSPIGQSGRHVDLIFGNITPYTEREHSKELWNASISGRIGANVGQLRVYGKVGMALSRKRYQLNGYFGPDEFFAEKTSTRKGLLVGGGLEQKIAPRVSMFLEYDYVDFGRKLEKLNCTDTHPNCGTLYPSYVPISLKNTNNRITVGINYHF